MTGFYRNRSAVVVAAACLIGGLAVGGAGQPEPSPARMHGTPEVLEDAVLSATRAFLREDGAAARKALDLIEAGCRRLNPEDEDTLGAETVNYDRAFHTTLNRARELATRGDLDRAFDQFVWVQKGCRVCHGLRRDPAPDDEAAAAGSGGTADE